MFKAYWNMTFNPFSKSSGGFCFVSQDYQEATSRLKFLTANKGIGLFTGLPGIGKTFVLRSYLSGLNPSLYKVFYTPLSTITAMDFYRGLSLGLDIAPASRKVDMFRQIQERIITLDREKRVTPLIVLDECQYLNTAILNDLKIIFNFDMDSANHAVVILAGLPLLNNILVKQVHESIAQRITINYMFCGLSETEANSYVLQGLRASGASDKVFQPAALAALYAASGGSIRKLNALITNALIAGAQKKFDFIDTDLIMDSLNEISIA